MSALNLRHRRESEAGERPKIRGSSEARYVLAMADETLTSKWPAPTPEQADAIAAETDPATRNLKITQSYNELTVALTRLFGSTNVSWCAYATYASKTAGAFIRGDEVPSLIRDYVAKADHLDESVGALNGALRMIDERAHVGHSFIVETIERVMRDVTSNVGQGNLIVFAELAPAYARLLQLFPTPPKGDAAEKVRLLAPFKPGPVDSGGQDLLIEAFSHYYSAFFETDPCKKAELIFFGNALVGYHEQIRLQGPIAGSLDAPLTDTLSSVLHENLKELVPEHKHGLLGGLLEKVLEPIGKRIEREWQDVCTRFLMTLTLPSIVLDLGKDVPPLESGKDFPADLAVIKNASLVLLLDKLDRTPNTSKGSAARDWAELGDRMNYVVDFFRSRQQDPTLYQQPFTDAQVDILRQGKLPPGAL